MSSAHVPSLRDCPMPPIREERSSGRSLWLWVGAAFLFLALLWAAMFTAARSITIETVPVQKEGVRK